MSIPENSHVSSGQLLIITHIFNAPRERVFAAWTNKQQIEQWWGPRVFTTRVSTLDFTPGGRWRYVMSSPDCCEYAIVGQFESIVAPQKIITTLGWEEDTDKFNGMCLSVAFDVVDAQSNLTKVTLTISHKSEQDREEHEKTGVVTGWESSFQRLDKYLESQEKLLQEELPPVS